MKQGCALATYDKLLDRETGRAFGPLRARQHAELWAVVNAPFEPPETAREGLLFPPVTQEGAARLDPAVGVVSFDVPSLCGDWAEAASRSCRQVLQSRRAGCLCCPGSNPHHCPQGSFVADSFMVPPSQTLLRSDARLPRHPGEGRIGIFPVMEPPVRLRKGRVSRI